MEAGLRLRALGHHRHYCGGGFKRGWLAAARGERRRRVGAASCSPALCSLAASGNGNGAAVGPVGSGAEVACTRRMLHVVLVSPLIPGNTGSIARTCAASAVGLHLVGPLGFKVDDTKLKRAGLDYWPYVVVKIHDSWDDFRDYFIKQEGEKRLLAFTKRGTSIHSMEKGKVKTPKAVWDAYATKIFCQICKEETLAGNRPGTTLSSIGYKNLEEKFFAITKRHYPHGKLKNKWDALKPQYNLWLELKRAATGLGFDVVKGTITASDEWWEEKIAENKKYAAFREAPMDNLDELEVMFQHINVTSLSSVIPGVQKTTTPIDVDDDSNDNEDNGHTGQDAKKEVKRKANAVDNPFSPKKKGRNPMVKQVSRLIDVLATSKSKNDQKVEDDIIELMDQAVNAGAREGSDEHFMASQLFVKRENRAVFRSIKNNEGKVAWLKRMYEERKRK